MKKKVLCITRKYPPQVGGMENFCFNLFSGLESEQLETKIVALGKKQIHLLWFFPYTIFYVIFNIHKYDAFLIGDSVMCFLGIVSKLFSPKTKRITLTYGLDILYKNPAYQAYLKMCLKAGTDMFVCISAETQKALKRFGVCASTVITPGIDISLQYKDREHADRECFCSKYDIDTENLVLITVGRLVKRKGVEWFIRNVIPHFTGRPVSYLIIGDGDERESIQNTIETLHLQKQVKMLGKISDEDLARCYQNAEVFVMPNIHVDNDMEGFGIVAAEASLNELIVLASGIEGILDAVIDGRNGYLMESGNPAGYINKIEDILSNRDAYLSLRKAFSKYTAETYSWSAICEEYRKLIFRILSHNVQEE